MNKIFWSQVAEDQLEEIATFSNRSSAASKKLVQAIVRRTLHLPANPQLGRVVPEFGYQQLRELIEQKYRIFYFIGPDYIEMVTVFHSSMELKNPDD